MLQAAGIAGDLEGFTDFAPIYEWRNATGEILLRFGREKDSGLSSWPESKMSHQPRLEAALEARARFAVGPLPRRRVAPPRLAVEPRAPGVHAAPPTASFPSRWALPLSQQST